MKITIIIPFYNEVVRINLENFHQIFNGFPHYNFLLVDDGSSDKTIEILEEFKSEFSTIEVLKLNNERFQKGIFCSKVSLVNDVLGCQYLG